MTSGDVESSSADQDDRDLIDDETENENADQDGDNPAASDIDDDTADQAGPSPAEVEIATQAVTQNDQSRTAGETRSGNGSQTEKGHVGGYTQAIGAEYFNITDAEAWPIAGLLVLLDGTHNPVRAELQFYEDLPADIEAAAVQQTQSILQKKYTGKEPLPLRFVLSVQAPEVMDVRLRSPGSQSGAPQSRSWIPMALAAAGVVAVSALIWIGVILLLSSGNETPVADTVATQSDMGNGGSVSESISDGSADGLLSTSIPELAPSVNARSDVDIGVRVRILPGLKLTLRSEAGPSAGDEIGFMTDGEEALVIGGPVPTRGTSDTIVWWFVRLDNGTEAWAAANTSNQTLLEPVP